MLITRAGLLGEVPKQSIDRRGKRPGVFFRFLLEKYLGMTILQDHDHPTAPADGDDVVNVKNRRGLLGLISTLVARRSLNPVANRFRRNAVTLNVNHRTNSGERK